MDEPIIDTTTDLVAALARISFINTVLDFKWQFEHEAVEVSTLKYGSGFYKQGWLVWVSFERPDTITGQLGRGRGRDEIVWRGATLSAAIKTAWVCFEMILKHEAMEGFRFDGQRIFNPHNSVLDLARVQQLHDQRLAVAGLTQEPTDRAQPT